MDAFEAALILIVPLALSLFAYKKNLMTVGATVSAFAMAEVIGFCGDIWWDIAFFMFPAIAFLATKWRLKDKIKFGLQEGKKGERHVLNLLGVGIIPTVIAIIYAVNPSEMLQIAFVSALAVSVSDTIASETGIWAKKTYMITTLKRIEPGPNGGVSLYGYATSAIGTLIFSYLACFFIFEEFSLDGLLDLRFLIPFVAGMFGNVMDSIFGAIFENKGYIDKYSNNASTALIGAVVGSLLFLLL